MNRIEMLRLPEIGWTDSPNGEPPYLHRTLSGDRALSELALRYRKPEEIRNIEFARSISSNHHIKAHTQLFTLTDPKSNYEIVSILCTGEIYNGQMLVEYFYRVSERHHIYNIAAKIRKEAANYIGRA